MTDENTLQEAFGNLRNKCEFCLTGVNELGRRTYYCTSLSNFNSFQNNCTQEDCPVEKHTNKQILQKPIAILSYSHKQAADYARKNKIPRPHYRVVTSSQHIKGMWFSKLIILTGFFQYNKKARELYMLTRARVKSPYNKRGSLNG